MEKKKLTHKQIELLIKLAKLLDEYEATIVCEDFGGIDIDMYVADDSEAGFTLHSVSLPEEFAALEIGDVLEEMGSKEEARAKMEIEEPGSYDRLFYIEEGWDSDIC